MSAKDEVLAAIAANRGWNSKQLDELSLYAREVGNVESKGDPAAVQRGGGPGRGKYQYELASGGSGRNATAIQRMKNFENSRNISLQFSPQEQAVLDSADPDFSQLSADTQEAIFYADAAMGATPLQGIVDGTVSREDAWIKHHWAGSDSVAPDRRKHWQQTNPAAATSTSPVTPAQAFQQDKAQGGALPRAIDQNRIKNAMSALSSVGQTLNNSSLAQYGQQQGSNPVYDGTTEPTAPAGPGAQLPQYGSRNPFLRNP